jgi:hypothetical protein
MGEIRSPMVIRAIYDLQRREGPQSVWPTAERIADYLRAPVGDVLARLRDLKGERLFTDRRRKGERVWMPWSET